MKKTLLLIALFCCFGLIAQNDTAVDSQVVAANNLDKSMVCGIPTPGNLVINGDFEQYSVLPYDFDHLPFACNWEQGTISADYLHRNSTNTGFQIPDNNWGNQDVNPIQGGDGYAHFGTSKNANGGVTTEVLRTQLSSALLPNTEYQLSFDVSLAETYSDNSMKLQAFLGPFIQGSGLEELPIYQTINNGILLENTEFSSNSDGWETITFCFTTDNDGGQEYLYLGGIYDVEFTPPGTVQRAHYYIDNVSLIEKEVGTITVTKEAYFRVNGNASTDVVYVNKPFEWRVTIENTIPDYLFSFEDIFPDASNNPICPFTIMDIDTSTLSGMPFSFPISTTILSGVVELPVDTFILSFLVRPCPDSTYNGTIFQNCFNYDDPDGVQVPVCDEVMLAYGCPAALSDGFCLLPENMEAGDVISSNLIFHISFSDINKMEGQLVYDPDLFATPSDLDDIFNFNTSPAPDIAYYNIDNGAFNFIFDYNPPFNIGSGGTYVPFSVNLELLEDLDGCTDLYINNLVITQAGNPMGFPIFVDPGEFCSDYGIDYESAWIITQPGDTCDDGSIDLTVIGPFETQNTGTTYEWFDDSVPPISLNVTTQTITVTTNGTYTVLINDSEGCDRMAEYTITDCFASTCVCGDLNPQINYSVDGCDVTATSVISSCNNLTDISYTWTFSNGTTYYGEFPPTQNFPGPSQDITITLEISYQLDNSRDKCYVQVVEYLSLSCLAGFGDGYPDKLSIYPNPATNNVIVDFTSSEGSNGSIELVDIYGSILLETPFENASKKSTVSFDVSKLQTGIYFIRLVDDLGSVEIRRLIINK